MKAGLRKGHSKEGRYLVTNSRQHNHRGLDNTTSQSRIPEIPNEIGFALFGGTLSRSMSAKSTASSPSRDAKQPCKHPRVQIVSRDEESEFVECKECGEIFDSSEFKDMNIEEGAQDSEI